MHGPLFYLSTSGTYAVILIGPYDHYMVQCVVYIFAVCILLSVAPVRGCTVHVCVCGCSFLSFLFGDCILFGSAFRQDLVNRKHVCYHNEA